jgi:hypothetical protein
MMAGIASKLYVDAVQTSSLQLSGGTMTGHIRMNSSEQSVPGDAATNNIFSTEYVSDIGGHFAFNTYLNNSATWKTRSTGYTGQVWLHIDGSMRMQTCASTTAGASQGTVNGSLILSQTGQLIPSPYDGDSLGDSPTRR